MAMPGGAKNVLLLAGGVGVIYYLFVHRGRPATVLAEHRAGPAPAAAVAADEQA